MGLLDTNVLENREIKKDSINPILEAQARHAILLLRQILFSCFSLSLAKRLQKFVS